MRRLMTAIIHKLFGRTALSGKSKAVNLSRVFSVIFNLYFYHDC